MMKRTLLFTLFGFAMLIAGYLSHPATTAGQSKGKFPSNATGGARMQSARDFFADLGTGHKQVKGAFDEKVDWVDKRCRAWAPDGDIDVDQTCLVVRNVSGAVSIIPNQYNDAWLAEIVREADKPLAAKDKWIRRFLEVRGW